MAAAAPLENQDQGTWYDGYVDSLGLLPVDGSTSFGWVHDPPGAVVSLADPGVAGQFLSSPVTPASFASWGVVRVAFTASEPDQVTVAFRDTATGTDYPVTLSPSPDGEWTAEGPITAPPTVTQGRVVVSLGTGVVAPTVQALGVTWAPKSVVTSDITAAPSACANDTVTYRIGVAVSYVQAQNLVISAPLPTATNNATETTDVAFVSATNGGTLVGDTVTWNLGDRPSGETFLLLYTVRLPKGTRDGTTYDASVTLTADNADPTTVAPATVTLQSSPAPWVRKTAGGAFDIGGTQYANTGTEITYGLAGGNFQSTSGTCGERFRSAVLWDDVTEVLGASSTGAIDAISGGGTFTASGTTVNGVSVPPNSVYWDLGDLNVGGSFNFNYRVTLDAGLTDGVTVGNTATLESGDQPQQDTSSESITVGIPETPEGTFATGDRIRGAASINAFANDNPSRTVGYTDAVTFLTYAENGGASALVDVVMMVPIPAGTTFVDAFLPASAAGTTYYSDTPGAAEDSPPDYDTSDGTFGPTWTTTPPAADTVTWVAFHVPRLASPYFPDGVHPVSARGEVTVTVDAPTNGCDNTTITARPDYWSYSYVAPFDTVVQAGPTSLTADSEPVQVIALRPNIGQLAVTDSSNEVVAGNDVTYTISIPNRAPGGADTDAGDNLVATITAPSMNVNGVSEYALFKQVSAPGAGVDISGLPNTLVLTWPKIFPDQVRTAEVTFTLPSGVINGTQTSLSVSAQVQDDVCGPSSAFEQENTTVRSQPYLQVSKDVDFSVAAAGTQVLYDITFINTGNEPSTGTWVVDRLPPGTQFIEAFPTAGGQVWFSDALPPTLPATLSAAQPVDADVIGSLFVPGLPGGGGWVDSPYGADTTWVAYQVDDPALTPPQFPTDTSRTVQLRLAVADDAPDSTVVNNEPAIVSDQLLQTVGNRTRVTVSALPSLRITQTCTEVAAGAESVVIVIDYRNDSTNADEAVTVSATLPDELTFVSSTHTFNDATLLDYPAPPADVPAQVNGSEVTFDVVGTLGGNLGPGAGGTITLVAMVASDVPSGTLLTTHTRGDATNSVGGLSVFGQCSVLIENADLSVSVTADTSAPRSGDTVGYTVLMSNEGANSASDVVLTVTLPSGLNYVPASTFALTPGWSLGEPVQIGSQLIWSAGTLNGLAGDGLATGDVPGDSGSIATTFQVQVADDVVPGTTLVTTTTVTTATVEDANFDNVATSSVTTPLPDPYVVVHAPPQVIPGEAATIRLEYGNLDNEDATGVLLIASLPELTYQSSIATHGETVWFADGTAPPAFDPSDPESSGWTQDASSLPVVSHVGFFVDTLDAFEGPFSAFVNVVVADPTTGIPPLPGTSLDTCGTIETVGQAATLDGDGDNNLDCTTLQTPGIDVSMNSVCSPSGAFPGVVPGGTIDLRLELANTGTVDTHGLRFTPTLPVGLSIESDDANTVNAETSAGLPASVIDLTGNPLVLPVSWVRDGADYVLGSLDSAAPDYYRNIGLAPGTRARVTLTLRVADDVADETVVAVGGACATDYRADWVPGDPIEENLTNNGPTCSTSVYRADPLVSMSVINLTTGSAVSAEGGDRVRFTTEYGNAGHFEADAAQIEGALPEGAEFVVGSLANLVSGDVTISYDDGTRSFDYVPTAAVGEVDAGVRGFRIAWNGPLGAPANTVFTQSSTVEFANNTLANVVLDADQQGISLSSDYVLDEACLGANCNFPSWCDYGVEFPEGQCCPQCIPEPAKCPTNNPSCDSWCPFDTCDVCDSSQPPTTDWWAQNGPCASAMSAAFAPYENCVQMNGPAACEALVPVGDPFAACASSTCPTIPAESCEWNTYFSAGLSNWHIAMDYYEQCVSMVGPALAANCEALMPRAPAVSCMAANMPNWCPDQDTAGACRWRGFTNTCSNYLFNTEGAFARCVSARGPNHPACADLQPPEACAQCFQSSCPAFDADSDGNGCTWRTYNNECTNLNSMRNSIHSSCIANTGSLSGCSAFAPKATCQACLSDTERSCPSVGSSKCTLEAHGWDCRNPIYNMASIYASCVVAVGNDNAAICDPLKTPDTCGECQAELCGDPDLDEYKYQELVWDLQSEYYNAYYRMQQCTQDTGDADLCQWLMPTVDLAPCWQGMAENQGPGDCAYGDITQNCQSFDSSRGYALEECIDFFGLDNLDMCEPYTAMPSMCRIYFDEQLSRITDGIQRAELLEQCKNSRVQAMYAFTGCLDHMRVEYADASLAFDYDAALTFCEPMLESAECGTFGCPTGDQAIDEAIATACDYGLGAEGFAYGECINRLNQSLADAGIDPLGLSAAQRPDAVCSGFEPASGNCLAAPDECTTGSVTTAEIPGSSEGSVVTWDRLVVNVSGDADGIVYTLLDPETGEPIPGFEALTADPSGAIDLSGLEPALYPRVIVRAEFKGDPDRCMTTMPKIGPGYAFVQLLTEAGVAVVNHSFPGGTVESPVVWDPQSGTQVIIDPATYGYDSMRVSDGNEGLTLVGEARLSGTPSIVLMRPPAGGLGTGSYSVEPIPDAGLNLYINATGWIVSNDTANANRTTVWIDIAGTLQKVPMPDVAGFTPVGASGITDAGVVFGTVDLGGGNFQAAVWTPDGNLPPNYTGQQLPLLGGSSSTVFRVTSTGYALGSEGFNSPRVYSADGTGVWHAFDLSALGQTVQISNISDGGRIAGNLFDGPGTQRPAIFVPQGTTPETWVAQELGQSQALNEQTWLFDINDSGLASMTLWDNYFNTRMGTWSAATGYKDLNIASTLLWVNNAGLMAGNTYASETDVFAIEPCATEGGPRLLDWTLLYTTDSNPTFSFDVDVANTCQSDVTASATISSSTPEVTDSNNSASASLPVNSSDVSVAIEADLAAAQQFDLITYTITWSNAGPGTARNVDLTANFPPILLPSDTAWSLGDLPAGATGTIEVLAVFDIGQAFVPATPLTTTVTSSNDSIDCAVANDSASATVVTGGWPNLELAATGPATAQPDATFTYTLAWENTGNVDATGVTLSATLPADVVLVTADGNPVQTGQQLDWTLLDIPPGGTGTFDVTVTAPSCGAGAADAPLAASIAAVSPESSVVDNAAQHTTALVDFDATLELLGEVDRATATTGDVVTYTLHVANSGGGSAASSSLAFTLPAGVTYVPNSASHGGVESGGVVTWTLGSLPSKATSSVTLRAVVDAATGATLTSSATLTAGGACPLTRAMPSIAVAAPGLRLTTTADVETTCGDAEITWAITLTNESTSTRTGVVVTDTVPTGTSYVAGSAEGVGFDGSAAPQLQWALGDLAPGQGVTLSYRTSAPPSGIGPVTNSASVSEGGAVGAIAQAVVTPDCNAELSLTKGWDGGCMVIDGPGAGDRTIVLTWENTSDQLIGTITVSDQVPAGMTFNASPDSPVVAGDVVTFTASNVTPGQMGAFTYSVTVDGGAVAGAVITNRAWIEAPGLPPRASNQVTGVLLVCDDANPCSVDTCAPALGCVRLDALPGTLCDDGDACTQSDSCQGQACVGAEPVVCTASDDCHVAGVCDPATGLCSDPDAPDGTDCDDGDACTEFTTCAAGTCLGSALPCDDANPCTDDTCDPVLGCQYTDVTNGTACDDGSVCTLVDQCFGGFCAGTQPLDCSPTTGCETATACDPVAGCVFTPAPAGTACDDGSACTSGDTCEDDGRCVGAPLACGAPDVCQLEGTCNPGTGICDYPVKPGSLQNPVGLADLGTLGGGTSEARAIGPTGAVVGASQVPGGESHAAFWPPVGLPVDLTPTAGVTSVATGVNASDRIVGHQTDATSTTAFTWTAADGLTVLWTMPDTTAVPIGPTVSGYIVGLSDNGGAMGVSLRMPDGTVVDAEPFAGVSSVVVVDLNDQGQMVGIADGEAILWQVGQPHTPLGDLGGKATPTGINDAGTVVGYSETATGEVRAFRWTAASGMTDLGVLAGGNESRALFINALGYVAGTSSDGTDTWAVMWRPDDSLVQVPPGAGTDFTVSGLDDMTFMTGTYEPGPAAWLWAEETGLVDLGDLGGSIISVAGIDASGRVAGTSNDGNGGTRAFVTSVPDTLCTECDFDMTAPDMVCPGSITVECDGQGNGAALGTPSVTDNCGTPPTVTNDAPVSFPLGATDVTFTATDSASNSATCVASVVVEDTVAPALTCPPAQSVAPDTGSCNATVDLAPVANDACDDDTTIQVLDNAPASFPPGDTTVEFVAFDSAGNSATCSTTVTVDATNSFVVTCPNDFTIAAPPDVCAWEERLEAEALDGCSVAVDVLVDERAFPVGETEVVFEASQGDQAASCTTRVTVTDITAPVVSCGAPASLPRTELPAAAVAEVDEACGAEVEVSDIRCTLTRDDTVFDITAECEIESTGGIVTAVYTPYVDTQVSWTVTATDPSGNTTVESCSMEVLKAGVPEELHAQGGGGCECESGSGVPDMLPVAIVALFFLWRRRRA